MSTPSKNSIYEQLMWFYDRLMTNDGFDIQETGWSEATTYRYLKELKERYNCNYLKKHNKIKLLAQMDQARPELKNHQEITKQLLMKYMVLKWISHSGQLSRSGLMEKVLTTVGDKTQREVDKWCKDLIEEGHIKQVKQGNSIQYCMKDAYVLSDSMHLDLIQLLSHYHMYLPNQENVTSLLHKLGLQGIQAQANDNMDLMTGMEMVLKCYDQKKSVKIQTEKGTVIRIIPLYLYYHANKKTWYMKYVRNSVRSKMTHHLNLKQRLTYHELEERQLDDEKIKILYEKSRAEDNLAFETVYESPIKVKILIQRRQQVYEKIYERLRFFGDFKVYDEDYILFHGTVYGRNEFLKWLRSFGSSIIILEPARERQKMINSIKKTLSKYEGV